MGNLVKWTKKKVHMSVLQNRLYMKDINNLLEKRYSRKFYRKIRLAQRDTVFVCKRKFYIYTYIYFSNNFLGSFYYYYYTAGWLVHYYISLTIYK